MNTMWKFSFGFLCCLITPFLFAETDSSSKDGELDVVIHTVSGEFTANGATWYAVGTFHSYNGGTNKVFQEGELVRLDTWMGDSVEIPSRTNFDPTTGNEQFQITRIGGSAFKDKTSVTSVTIPMTVTTIDSSAFSGSGLTSITIPSTVSTIGSGVFSKCTNLESVTLQGCPSNLDGRQLFEDCTSLKSVLIPNGWGTLPAYMFNGCTSLETVSLPDSLITIDTWAFKDCSALTEVKLPPNLVTVPSSAPFSGCDALRKVNIPKAFADKNPGVLFGDAAKGITEVSLDEGIVNLGEEFFYGCDALTTVIWPESIQSLGNKVFYSCDSLKSMVLPDSITSIGTYLFSGCAALESVTLPDALTTIPTYTFNGNKALKSITIPEQVETIGRYAFLGCTSLTEVRIPASVKTIDTSAFSSCSNLTAYYFDGEPPTVASNFASVTGYYPAEHADAWETVISKGKWKNLTMQKIAPNLTFDDDITADEMVKNWLTEKLAGQSGKVILDATSADASEHTTLADLQVARLLGVVPKITSADGVITVAVKTSFEVSSIGIENGEVVLKALVTVGMGDELPSAIELGGTLKVNRKDTLAAAWEEQPLVFETPVIERLNVNSYEMYMATELGDSGFYQVVVDDKE